MTSAGEESQNQSHFTYMLLCSDDSIYTGYTTDLARRVQQHNAGQGARYTRGRRPVLLVHWEEYGTRSLAQQREYELKQLSHQEKVDLIARDQNRPAGGVRVPE